MYVDSKSKVAAIICYLFSWVGLIIAFLIRDKGDRLSLHHINQALVLAIAEVIAGILSRIPKIGGIISTVTGIAAFVLAIMGIVRAVQGSDEPLPFIGEFHILN